MKEKLDTTTYLTIFAVSFIGFLIAFFLGVWVGGKATFKPDKTKFQENVNLNDDFNPAYEEIGQKHNEKPSFKPDRNEKAIVKKTVSAAQKSETKKLQKKQEITNSVSTKVTKAGAKKNKPSIKKQKTKSVTKTKISKEQRYMLQIGAYKRLKDAKKLKNRFESKGYSVFIVKEKGKKSVFYKVRIGTFYSKKIAYKVKRKIEREDKIKAWLVPIK